MHTSSAYLSIGLITRLSTTPDPRRIHLNVAMKSHLPTMSSMQSPPPEYNSRERRKEALALGAVSSGNAWTLISWALARGRPSYNSSSHCMLHFESDAWADPSARLNSIN